MRIWLNTQPVHCVRSVVRRLARRLVVGALFVGSVGSSFSGPGLAAQGARPASPSATDRGVGPRWVIVAPDAALAWFDLMADLRLPGAGAFSLTDARSGSAPTADPALARALARSRESEVLHFVPLYHPSADRSALAAALRAAAATPAVAPTPRAGLLVGALAQTLPAESRRGQLPPLAAALERRRPVAPSPERLRGWQRELDSLYLPALAPWLALERLDTGRMIVAPGIGAEGRIFAGTRDRADNLVAVGAFGSDPDESAPLLAFVRELCCPAVSRATSAAVGFDSRDPDGARRASLAAVRCGAALLDSQLPARADAFRAFWLRRAVAQGLSGAQLPGDRTQLGAAFDRVFPPDPALSASMHQALGRLRTTR